MYNVIREFRVHKYVLLTFDKPIKERVYSKVIVDGIEYRIVPSYDIPGIAIESPDSFVGKTVTLG